MSHDVAGLNLYTYVTDEDPNGWLIGKQGNVVINKTDGVYYKWIANYTYVDVNIKDWNSSTVPQNIINKPSLSTVATSGNYSDLTGKPSLFDGDYNSLTNKPSIPANQVQTDWNAISGLGVLLNKPSLFSGSYTDLTNKPTLFDGTYASLTGKPTLATVSSTGSYNDLINKPTIPSAQVNCDWNSVSGISQILNKPTLFDGQYSSLTGKPTLFSGSYTDLTNKPTLFDGTYASLTGKPTFATVATSGSYNDLSNKPVLSKAYTGTTLKTDCFRIYKNATVSSGTAVFHLTDDGLSTGNALFTNEVFTDSVQVNVNDSSASYQMSWVFSNSNKTLTVTANKLTTANILTGILGQTQANGASVRLYVEGR